MIRTPLPATRRYAASVIVAWKAVLRDRVFTLKLLLAPALFFVYSAITQHIGNYVELRKGTQLHDKLLAIFPSFDFSVPVFYLLYISMFTLIITHLNKPRVILRVIEMHLLVAIVRQLCILLIALEPPAGIIVLRDLFLENTVYPHDAPLTKDLFFSGHVASIWIYFLCAQRKFLKVYFVAATLCMAFMLLSMRVHYSYDVYGAIFFTTLIYFAPSRIRQYYTARQAVPVE
ncbi:MAG: hypothetical protein KDC07_04860 [Chitinophagaceae bacterium]|nr:hypothetical protein [Chitinophagaceae bacterium]